MQLESPISNKREKKPLNTTKQQTHMLCTGCSAYLIPASYWKSISSVQFYANKKPKALSSTIVVAGGRACTQPGGQRDHHKMVAHVARSEMKTYPQVLGYLFLGAQDIIFCATWTDGMKH
jgi:hypothetical protein